MLDTIFGKIARGEIPADILYQDEDVVAFRDLNPQAPTHVLVIPRKPIPTLNDLEEGDAELVGKLFLAARKVAEQEGIATYVHVPSPGLLRMFLDEGLTRFVFEGRESGGHVGPFCSFVLFEAALRVLMESAAVTRTPDKFHLLFAGGIHDALSASMIAAMAGGLAARGVKVGLQLGTAYLFTEEAVTSGAIVGTYQREALGCTATSVLVSSPGHAERVIPTPFARLFQREKWQRTESGATAEEVRQSLEHLKLGRLRIATKGIARNPDHRTAPHAPEFVHLDEDQQRQQGLYLVGQVAAMRERVIPIEELHRELCLGGSDRLDEIRE